ncbi:MAG: SLC13 family permease [Hyphomicrobiales bacterium]
MDITHFIFFIVYLAMGLGHIPGFKVDRTGAALIGGIAMIVAGSLTPEKAWNAIDYRTIGMLFGLMVVSAAFVVSGFYAFVAHWVATLPVKPPALLAILIIVAGSLSSLLTNDVVVVAMTPLLVQISLARGLNPIPFLLAFCFAANTGAAGTIIGSPQNMIAAQALHLSFLEFLKTAGPPALLSLPIVWSIVTVLYRGRWHLAADNQPGTGVPAPIVIVNKWETIKAALVTLGVVAAFTLTDWPRSLVALSAAGVLLLNRRIASGDMMKHVDGNLLLMLMGLFIVNAALAATGTPQQLLAGMRAEGLDTHAPVWLFLITSILCNLVGNNPAVMLLVPYLDPTVDPNALGAALALGTGFSCNLILFGSLAGIIVVEEARARGVKISFAEFARSGVPVALACMVLAIAWLLTIT